MSELALVFIILPKVEEELVAFVGEAVPPALPEEARRPRVLEDEVARDLDPHLARDEADSGWFWEGVIDPPLPTHVEVGGLEGDAELLHSAPHKPTSLPLDLREDEGEVVGADVVQLTSAPRNVRELIPVRLALVEAESREKEPKELLVCKQRNERLSPSVPN